MTAELAKADHAAAIESALIQGDLKHLNTEQKLAYYKQVCDSVGLNHLTQPFEYIVLNNRLTLYARKNCAEQLRKIHNVSISIVARELVEDCYIVTARAEAGPDIDRRMDESIGAVSIAGLKGENRANAMMKAETKAKRRVTLSICGLGMLDETEVETIPNAHRVEMSVEANSLSPEEQAIAKANAKPNPNPMCTQDHLDTISQLCRELGMDMADKRQVMNELGITVRENKMRMADAQKLTVHLLRKCVEKHLAAKGITLDDVKNHIRIAADMPEDLDEEQAGAALGVLRSWDKLGVPA